VTTLHLHSHSFCDVSTGRKRLFLGPGVSTSAFFCSGDVATYLRVVKRGWSDSNCPRRCGAAHYLRFLDRRYVQCCLYFGSRVFGVRYVLATYPVSVRRPPKGPHCAPPLTNPLLSPVLPFNLLNIHPSSEPYKPSRWMQQCFRTQQAGETLNLVQWNL
jgi:hypothetical protein